MKRINVILFVFMVIGLFFVSCRTPPPPSSAEDTIPVQSAPAVNTEPPALGVSLSSRFFSPDGDGENDVLTITLTCRSSSAVSNWTFEIFEPESPNLLFRQWSGNGNPPASLTWDGKSSKGELVQSASDYPYKFTVKNAQNSANSGGVIPVDILVIRDGNVLRVQIPSIFFAPNISAFGGLSPELSASNEFVLGRIAVTLNRFRDYQIKVEGHANLTAPTPAQREKEHTEELLPLSERRAKTVADYLVSLGVDRNRLSYFGIGGSRPVAKYEDHDNWWKNRRVEFILVK